MTNDRGKTIKKYIKMRPVTVLSLQRSKNKNENEHSSLILKPPSGKDTQRSNQIINNRPEIVKPGELIISDSSENKKIGLTSVATKKIQHNEHEDSSLTSENYLQLFYRRLLKEYQSYLDAEYPKNMTLTADAIMELGKNVLKTIQAKRIFTVHGYYPIISSELKKRGWIEKRNPKCMPLNYEHFITSKNSRVMYVDSPPLLSSETTEAMVLENLKNTQTWLTIKDEGPNYIFTTKRKYLDLNTISDTTTLSQINKLTYCTKNGLTNIITTLSKRIAINYPRSYNISDRDKLNDFIRNYRLTAIVGSLKNIVQLKETENPVFTQNGTIPYEMIDFIEQRNWEFLNAHRLKKPSEIPWSTYELEERWKQFMIWYYKMFEENATIRLSNTFQINDTYERCTYLMQKLKPYSPQFKIDGNTNLWIIKPVSSCSGYGIKLERNFGNISRLSCQKFAYTIQKYIENPFLIFNVKIDLRQYFLVTNFNEKRLWMYKEGYVRFCSKEYSVIDLSENIHLSNVRIQSKYRKFRSPSVPDECMWSFGQFQQYLTSINSGNKWDELIYPKMCETIVSVIQNSNQSICKRFSFQLLGADFVLTKYLEPWLIEINSSPGLNPTTSIIAKIATMLLKDTVKVTVDHLHNPNAQTGLFENVYTEQNGKFASEHDNY